MSRTDKTAPTWVKMTWVPREHHDHRFHECNLAESPATEQVMDWRTKYRNCYWDTDWYNPIFRCGCSMCGYDNRQMARKSRHDAKAAIKAERWDDLTTSNCPNYHWCD